MKINYLFTISFLLCCTFFDIKTKKIPAWLLLLFTVFGLLPVIQNPEDPFWLALIPGTVLLALAYCTKESIGFGDGFIVLILGLFIGYRKCLSAVIVGFLLTSVFSAILLIGKKASRKSRIPYIPFLTAGFGVALWM